jgi:hypothetical protein
MNDLFGRFLPSREFCEDGYFTLVISIGRRNTFVFDAQDGAQAEREHQRSKALKAWNR